MNGIVAGVIGIFTLLNISSYFIMASKTPPFTSFLGTVHYPMDYQYYLSFISQGRDHWIRAYHLFTGETTQTEFLNWIYVFSGHLGSILGLSAPVIYQIMVILGSIAYLLIAYKLATLLIPKNKPVRLLLYIMFLISNAFPNISSQNGSLVFGYFYPYNNWGHPFIRLTNVPHHLLIQFFIMGIYYVSIRYWYTRNIRFLVIASVFGFLLSSMQPLQWAYTTGIIGISGAFVWWKNNRSFAVFAPALSVGLSGLVPALYLVQLYKKPLYSFGIAWESRQQIYISFRHFIELNGPLTITAIIGLPFVLRRLSITTFPLLFNAVLTICVFFSPIPPLVHIMNLRFFSVMPTLAFAYITAELLFMAAKKIDRENTYVFMWFAALIIMAITIPVTVRHLINRTNTAPVNDVNAYLPKGAAMIYAVASRLVDPTEITLVEPLFSSSFAGITGRHVFVSNPFAMTDYDRKIIEATEFFYKKQTPEEKSLWLKKNNISYIFTYAWTPLMLPDLKILESNDYAIFYKVIN